MALKMTMDEARQGAADRLKEMAPVSQLMTVNGLVVGAIKHLASALTAEEEKHGHKLRPATMDALNNLVQMSLLSAKVAEGIAAMPEIDAQMRLDRDKIFPKKK